MDSVQNSTEYIVQWPPWVSAILALGLMASLYSLIAEALRRRFGLKAVWIGALLSVAGLGVFIGIAMARAADPPGTFLGVVTVIITVTAMFLAPSYGIAIGARRGSPSMARQVGFGVLAAYSFAAAAVLLIFIIGVAIR